VPVNADVHDIKVIFVDEPDDIINPLGSRGWAKSAWLAWRRRLPMRCITHGQARARPADHAG